MLNSQLENGTNFSLRRTDLITILLGTPEALLGDWGRARGGGGGGLEEVRADISYPLKYLLRFKISTNDSGMQRKFLSR